MTKNEVISILNNYIEALREFIKGGQELQKEFAKYGYRGEQSILGCIDLIVGIQSKMRTFSASKKRISALSDSELASIDLQDMLNKALESVEYYRNMYNSLRNRLSWI